MVRAWLTGLAFAWYKPPYIDAKRSNPPPRGSCWRLYESQKVCVCGGLGPA